MEKPSDVGRPFKIRVKGHRVEGWFNGDMNKCAVYSRGAWYYWYANTLEDARDIVRVFHETCIGVRNNETIPRM